MWPFTPNPYEGKFKDWELQSGYNSNWTLTSPNCSMCFEICYSVPRPGAVRTLMGRLFEDLPRKQEKQLRRALFSEFRKRVLALKLEKQLAAMRSIDAATLETDPVV